MSPWLALLLIPLIGFGWFESRHPEQGRRVLLWAGVLLVVGLTVYGAIA